MTNLCCRCHRQPAKPRQAYCIACSRAYQREWARRKRGHKARPIKPIVEPGEKFCTGCERTLPISRFSRCKSKPDGRMSHCKECDYIKQLRWKEQNRDYIRERDRLNARQWRQAHPNYDREWNEKHPGARKRSRLAQMLKGATNDR